MEVVLAELDEFINRSVMAHALAIMGLRQIPSQLQRIPAFAENPDPDFFVGIGDPNVEMRPYGRLKRSEVLGQVVLGGPVDILLGQQWVVYVFTAWEHGFRPRLAAAHGCEASELTYPLFGDLRLLRNDVVHHHGIATAEWTGRCEVLRWFQAGEELRIKGEHLEEFVRRFPWAEMQNGPRLP